MPSISEEKFLHFFLAKPSLPRPLTTLSRLSLTTFSIIRNYRNISSILCLWLTGCLSPKWYLLDSYIYLPPPPPPPLLSSEQSTAVQCNVNSQVLPGHQFSQRIISSQIIKTIFAGLLATLAFNKICISQSSQWIISSLSNYRDYKPQQLQYIYIYLPTYRAV